MTRAFPSIPIPRRQAKPRDRGVTMMVDWGTGTRLTRDVLEMAAPYCDLVRLTAGISRLVEERVLRRKVGLYRRFQVDAFPGGLFLEYAVHRGLTGDYLAECLRAGYRSVEVSDTVFRFHPGAKADLIRRAREDWGMRVLGKVGTKRTATERRTLVADIEEALRAGAWKVCVEAAEFFDGRLKVDLVREIAASVPVDRIIFELPGCWLKDIHLHQVYETMRILLGEMGPEVNLGNVLPADLLMLETQRVNLGLGMRL